MDTREESIFAEAIEIADPQERARFLERACAGNAALRAAVESLLAAFPAGSFLEVPAVQRPPGEPGDHVLSSATQAGPASRRDEKVSLEFLTRSEKPGSLGRLAHYEILEVIGQGGMGIVLRAFDEKLQRVVAIKVMASELAATSPPRKRFLREARAAAAVRHEHVVDIHAVEEQPIPYLVMEYVAGETLQQKLDRVGPLETPEVLRLGEQIARGLAAAHERGLIHRDIKPSNILLEKGAEERVKITDFGLARAAADASLTQSGVIAGTPMYMAPEQTLGDTIDYRADLFSLGSVLYTMASGRPPFRATTSMATLKRVAEDEPRPIREIIPEVPQWLCNIIAKLHAKRPEERFQTAKEVAALLGQHLAHLENPALVPMPAGVQPVGVTRPESIGVARPESSKGVGNSTPFEDSGRATRRWVIAAAVLLLLCGGLSLTEATGVTNLRATVIRIFTPDGTLVVETDDPGVKVTVEGDGDLVITGAGPHEVRLKPGSYKLQAAKDGKPVQLDRELVSIAKGGKEIVRVKLETPPGPVVATADKGAFVVLGGKGAEVGKFDTLVEAVKRAGSGDTIEVRGNGPFVTDPLDLGPKALTIRAGAGHRPVIKPSLAAMKSDGPLLNTRASLTVEGLELYHHGLREGNPFRTLISSHSAPLYLANCKLVVNRGKDVQVAAIQATNAPRLETRNCLIVSWTYGFLLQGPTKEFTLDNCLLTDSIALTGGAEMKSPGAKFHLTRNTIAGGWYVNVGGPADPLADRLRDPDAKPIVRIIIEAEASICQAGRVFYLNSVTPKYPEGLPLEEQGRVIPKMIQWRERGNVYGLGKEPLLGLHAPYVGLVKNLAEWNRFWGLKDTGSVQAPVLLRGNPQEMVEVENTPEAVTPDDFRVRPDSAGYKAGKDKKDLGADVDLVGPGAAYEKWKRTPEYQQWLEDTGQATRSFPRGSSADILTSSRWEWTKAENLGPQINTAQADGGPTLSADGLTLIYHSKRPGGSGQNDLWMSTRISLEAEWGNPVNLGATINSPFSDADACLSADGLTLIFDSNRPGGSGGFDLWMATRRRVEDAWSAPVNLGTHINSETYDGGPALSADGLTLVFNSDRSGVSRLWQCSRASLEQPWSSPKNLGEPVNSRAYQGWAALANDGLALVFNSNRSSGPPSGPLWIATRSGTTESWSVPIRLHPEESETAWSPCLSADATTLLFDSKRPGGQGDFDIWMMRRVKRQASKPEADAFVVLGDKGVEVGKFDTLADAVKRAGDRDTIEVRGSGPFFTDPIDLGTKALTIRAGSGYLPVIKPSPAAVMADAAELLRTASRLTLEGLELHHEGVPETSTAIHRGIVGSMAGQLSLTNCTLIVGRRKLAATTYAVAASTDSTGGLIRNCLIMSPQCGIHLWNVSGGSWAVDNCLIAAPVEAVWVYPNESAAVGTRIRLSRNQLVGGHVVGLPGPGAALAKRLRDKVAPQVVPSVIEVDENVIHNSRVFHLSSSNPDFPEGLPLDEQRRFLPQLVRWRERSNVYAPGDGFLLSLTAPPTGFLKDLAEWDQYWGLKDTGSVQGRVLLRGNPQGLLESNPDAITPAHFRLRPDSTGYQAGKDGKDLGADVDLVGPGAAYEKWKKTPDYQQWLKDTRQRRQRPEAKPEPGAFVLLGGKGVEVGKFDTLAAAVSDAQGGDTIEVRGNGPFVTDPLDLGPKALTIRAGAGYVPVIIPSSTAVKADAQLLKTDGRLTLEGLELHHEGLPEASRNRGLIGSNSAPLYLTNCKLVIHPRKYADTWAVAAVNPSLGQLRNCLVVSPGYGIMFYTHPRLQWTVENCLIASTWGPAFYLQAHAHNPLGPKLRLARNTLASSAVMTLAGPEGMLLNRLRNPAAEAVAPALIESEENICQLWRVFSLNSVSSQAPEGLTVEEQLRVIPKLIRWRERGNVYGLGEEPFLNVHRRPTGLLKDLAEWRRFWGLKDTGSLQGSVLLRGDPKALIGEAPEDITPDDFRLVEGSAGYRAGKDKKDLGADVDLVGPGLAYETWKKTPEYLQWLKETGQKK